VAAGNAAAATSTVAMATSRRGFLMALLLCLELWNGWRFSD
jgi:hypothetical protein